MELDACSSVVGGWNNRVYRLKGKTKHYCLKWYNQHQQTLRLEREFAFLKYAKRLGIRSITTPIACSVQYSWALYDWVDGTPYTQVRAQQVQQALGFILQLNPTPQAWQQLAPASEFCRDLDSHFNYLRLRLEKVANLDDPAVVTLWKDQILPLWEQIKSRWHTLKRSQSRLFEILQPDEYCASPSDFGFHNALQTQTGPVFIDFEYAGRDDPAQLVCDFFCQFEVPAPLAEFDAFSSEFAKLYPRQDWHLARMHLLMPLHRLKWLCIALNHFTQAPRREFAQRDSEAHRQQQVKKAKNMIDQLEKDIPQWLTLTF